MRKTVKAAPTREVERRTKSGALQVIKTKYSKAVHKKVCQEIAKGVSITDAGLIAGLGKDTIHDWLSKGRHAPGQHPELALLAQDVEVAQAIRRGRAVENIITVGDSQAPGSWQANAWFLERTDPENWGRKDRVEVQGGDKPQTQINTVVLIDGDAREAARDVLQRIAAPSGEHLAIGSGSGVQLEAGDS